MNWPTPVLLFLFATSAFAQSLHPDGFSDIQWRTKKEEVRRIMLAREGISFWQKNSGPTRVAFKGGTFIGKPAVNWGFEFVDDGLYRGAVLLKSFGDRGKQYDEMRDLIGSKYGPPTSSSRDGGHSRTVWKFPATLKEKDACVIILWNNPRGEGIHITYRNETMKAGDEDDSAGL
jgi:hypothetical protein